ncbi:hypothetical protein MUK42_25937 [Musa troglodytarum]|uniref:Uncharacterized protein n=1 Tax=Musa troglodytarum TaxID=320322 RepID=A0A9E7JP16_9LILI|nr:hypothetical protein MUK42_25937 [Musa troglodytarum]
MEEAAGLIALTAASVEDDEIDDGVAGKLAASDDSAGGGSRGGGSDIAGGGSTAEVGGGNSNRKGDWWKSRRPSSSRKPTEPLSPPLASKNPPGSGKVDGIWEENGGGIAAADASISSSRFSTIIASPTSGVRNTEREDRDLFVTQPLGKGAKKEATGDRRLEGRPGVDGGIEQGRQFGEHAGRRFHMVTGSRTPSGFDRGFPLPV